LGALIASRHPRNPIGLLFGVIGATQAGVEFATEYAVYGLITRPGSVPGGSLMAWFGDWLWFPGYALILTFLLLLFPDGRLLSRRWRPVAWLALVSLALELVAALSTLPLQAGRTTVGQPIEGEAVADLLGGLGFMLLLPAAALSALSLVFRWRTSRGIERQQMKWFVFMGVLGVALLVVSNPLEGSLSSVLEITGALLPPLGVAVAILRYRLYDIDVVINRSLVYGLLSGAVVGGYVGIVALIESLFDRAGIEASLVATAVVAVAFQPLRERLQRAANRLIYGQRDDPYGILSALGRKLEGAGVTEAVLPGVTQSIADALRLPFVAIDLVSGGVDRTVASVGKRTAGAHRWPLSYQGGTIGQLSAAPRAGEEFSTAERRIIEDVARHASVAAHAVLLTEDLRRSRERLRMALEEERRRIRRDLHDGLGPSLATVVVGIEEARNTYARDPGLADRLLRDLKRQTQDAIKDIRALVYDLRPPALDQLGLVAAIREQAMRLAGRPEGADGLAVTVEAPEELPLLPAAVEVAAFRVVQEGLTNVLRHARASSCSIRLSADAGLVVSVSDDGTGLPEGYRAGVGISSMRERAAELGGDLTVTAGSNGTTISVRFPLERS
jgi:signal transduction histidine kinase